MSQPYKCPVCYGKGKVQPGFYSYNPHVSSSASEEVCKSCNGTGIVWEEGHWVHMINLDTRSVDHDANTIARQLYKLTKLRNKESGLT